MVIEKNPSFMNRRQFVQLGLGCGALSALALGGKSVTRLLGNSLLAADALVPKRFLQIFLHGGWDSALATDPVTIAKEISGHYAAEYPELGLHTVRGKNKLVTGPGLVPAHSAFSSMPTLFINGLFVEVTSHELARKYMYSGRLTLSRSREYPAFVALMNGANATFPAHTIIGSPIPLSGTLVAAPPLQASSLGSLQKMIAGTQTKNPLGVQANQAAETLLHTLNSGYFESMTASARAAMEAWELSEKNLEAFYARNLQTMIKSDDALKEKYGFDGDWDDRARLAAAFLVMKSGLSSLVTVNLGGFDTHSNHFSEHLPLMTRFATTFNTLVDDLKITPDPESPSHMLSETTTLLVTSEFVRTPALNAGGGTDHWQSGSAILMGESVVDNRVIGATDDQALAMRWVKGHAQPAPDLVKESAPENMLLPDLLGATILDQFGQTTAANVLSSDRIAGVFK